jgi:hypothetical protein
MRFTALLISLIAVTSCARTAAPTVATSPHSRFTVSIPASFQPLPVDEYPTFKPRSSLEKLSQQSAYIDRQAGICVFLNDDPVPWPQVDKPGFLRFFTKVATALPDHVEIVCSETLEHESQPVHHILQARSTPHARTASVYIFQEDAKLSNLTIYYDAEIREPSTVETEILRSLNSN